MPTGALVSIEEYLHSNYEPDYEYQDGELIERNAGESPHSWLHGLLCAYLWRYAKKWGIIPFAAQALFAKCRRVEVQQYPIELKHVWSSRT